MPQLFRPPRVTPTPLEPSPPLDPVSMPGPPPPAPAPPLALAAAEDEERLLSLPMLLPKAVTSVFGGMNRCWGMALVGFHAAICVVKVLSFTTDPEVARFWTRIFRASLYIEIAALVLMTCARIYTYYYVDLPQQEAAAASQLPPPPPEMDMC